MIKNYRMKDYTYGQLKKNVSLPKFQRSLVWDSDRKSNFINTVREGNPFGVLLIYDDPVTRTYKIIDGLQRFTTLQDYEKNPFNYVKIDETEYKEVMEIVNFIHNVYQESDIDYLVNQVIDFISSIFRDRALDLSQINVFEDALLKLILSTYAQIKSTPEALLIQKSIYALWKRISSNISINDLEIPAIIYHGDESELPTIFERLNTGGTSLTKYEVFASTWSNTVIRDVDSDIAKIIDDRYKYLTNETQMQIDNYTEGEIIDSKVVTLYEYCFALGKVIKKNAPIITNRKGDNDFDNVESIGFSTLVSFLGLHLRDMAKLSNYINESIRTTQLNHLKKSIIESYRFIEEVILEHTSYYTKYIEAQVISMATVWFKMNHSLDLNTLKIIHHPVTNDVKYKFQKFAPFRFFNDIIKGYWAGSGDSKLYDIIKEVKELNRYTTPIQESVWESNLSDWIDSQIDKPMKTITSENKMFISFISRPYVGMDYKDFSCYWIIPKKRLIASDVNKAFSHIANICWFPKSVTSKYDYKSLVLYEGRHIKSLEIELLQEITYPTKEVLDFVINNQIEEYYFHYLKYRTKILIESFIRILPV